MEGYGEVTMRYYVYALIDPTNSNQPFYIGKGLDNRLQSHFKEAAAYYENESDISIVGCDTNSIMEHAKEVSKILASASPKLQKINELSKQGFDHTHVARIVARNLNESTALVIEACLIKSVYGIENLKNIVEGAHSEKFRPFNTWTYIDDFDQKYSPNGKFVFNGVENRLGRYYVYALHDPETKEIFYVGKGTANRIMNHFEEAINSNSSDDGVLRLKRISNLLDRGFRPSDIGRIIARVSDESHAFNIEALFVKFVFGINSLTNIQPGHHSGFFRARNDWEKRIGFDLPFVINPGARVDRQEKLDLMIGEGLDIPLMEIQNAFPNLVFDAPKILDASELGIEADVGNDGNQSGVRIKIFIRRKKIQIELRPRTKSQVQWIKQHFSQLEAYPLRRADNVFFPDKWRGSENMTEDIQEAIRRVKLFLDIVSVKSRKDLSQEALSLLDGLPKK
jgi:hypothetical protein